MLRLAANISTLFLELPLEQRPGAAARAGFAGVELRFLDGAPSKRFLSELRSSNVEMVGFNAHPGNFADGELGLASLRSQSERFRDGIYKDLGVARALGAANMHVLAGKRDQNLTDDEQFEIAIEGYGWAAEQAREEGVTVLVEPLAPQVAAGYFICSLERAVRLVKGVGSPNLKILFDLFHMQLAGGDILGRFGATGDLVGHVQIAAAPSRAEPDRGELCMDYVLDGIEQHGYSGWIGCEYTPATTTLEGLGWAKNRLAPDRA